MLANSLQQGTYGRGVLSETYYQHYLTVVGSADEHIPQEAVILAYVVETQLVTYCVVLYEEAD